MADAWKTLILKEEFGRLCHSDASSDFKAYSAYKLNNLDAALHFCKDITQPTLKSVLEAQIYYRKGDYEKSIECYKASGISSKEAQFNINYMQDKVSSESPDDLLNAILIRTKNTDYTAAMQLIETIDSSLLDDEDSNTLLLQKSVVLFHLNKIEKAIILSVELLLQLESPFYVSPKIKQLLSFVQQWPDCHKTASKKQTRSMQSQSSIVIPATLNLLAFISTWLSRYCVKQFIEHSNATSLSKCKKYAYLFNKSLKSNCNWMKYLSTYYSPYEDNLKIAMEMGEFYSKVSKMSIEDMKMANNNLLMANLTINNQTSLTNAFTAYMQVRNGKIIEAKHDSNATHVYDREEYMDLTFNE